MNSQTVILLGQAEQERRTFLKGVGAGLLATALMSARATAGGSGEAALSYRQLSALQAHTLDALGDALLPGAAAAGISRYIDDQLASAEPLLLFKYVDFPQAAGDFYRQSLDSLEQHAQRQHESSFHQLTPELQAAMVGEIAQGQPEGWSGPPAPLFYFIARNDAVDVCYGTEAGFAKLEVPYMAHIAPSQPW